MGRTWRVQRGRVETALIVGVGAMAIVAGAMLSRGLTHRYTPQQIARLIGQVYGDPHGRVVSARTDQTEGPPFHPMYLMRIVGRFHQGRLHASSLAFSAVADHLYVWGITATNGRSVVWTRDQWPSPFAQAVLTPAP